jgi:hypothetical protein
MLSLFDIHLFADQYRPWNPPVLSSGSSINFGNRSSALKFSAGTKLNVSSGNTKLEVDGTLVKDWDAEFAGNTIQFIKGVLESDGSEALMTAVFDPTDSDYILLNGSCSFDAEPGIVIQKMNVSSDENRLEGQPLFREVIDFEDVNTTLTMALQNKLNQNINMNGGLIRLAHDLGLYDTVYLVGPGRIILNHCTCSLGAYYNAPWDTRLHWDHATDIVLNGRTELTGEWYFQGESRINGNGNVLDLSNGGTIYVAPGSTLYLEDIYIRGLGDSYDEDTGQWLGKIVLGDDNSQVRTFNTDIELVNDYTTTLGTYYVEGPTTFILKYHDWTFNNDSLLKVDGVSLWLDTIDDADWADPGQLQAPLPIYAGHYWQTDYVAYNLTQGNLDLINSGTIREVCDRSQALSSKSTRLTREPLLQDLYLDQSIHIHPHQVIEIADDLVIDGRGAELVFSNPKQSQFVVNPGKTVTLKNIELDRINAKTFNLQYAYDNDGNFSQGQIKIGENVVFGLSENITFSQGLLTLDASAECDDDVDPHDEPGAGDEVAHTFCIRGVDGIKQFNIWPDPDVYIAPENVVTQYEQRILETEATLTAEEANVIARENANLDYRNSIKLVNIRHHTLCLQNLNLVGIEHITYNFNAPYVGAIGLMGDASVDVGDIDLVIDTDENLKNDVFETYDLHFVADSLNNKLRILKNNIKFTGEILFADFGENVLHIDFLLTERIGTQDDWWAGQKPTIRFGNGVVKLTSFAGMGRLIFDDAVLTIHNDSNAFVARGNAYLGGRHLEITGDPIWDFYDPTDYDPSIGEKPAKPFIVEVEQLEALQDLNYVPIQSVYQTLSRKIEEPFEVLRSSGNYITALHLLYQKERERRNKTPKQHIRPKINHQLSSKPSASKPKPKPRLRPRPTRDGEYLDEFDELDEFIDMQGFEEVVSREVQLPTGKVNAFYEVNNIHMSEAKGNVSLYRSTATRFSVSPDEDLNLTLTNAGILKLRYDQDVTLKDNDIINVISSGNEIHVPRKLTINGDLLFKAGSELIFKLEGTGSTIPEIVFGENVVLDLERDVELRFEGKGIVRFSDGNRINLKGTTGHKPSFVLKDLTILDPGADATTPLTFAGIGEVVVADTAKLSISEGRSLKFGVSTRDDIDLKVLGTGMVLVEAPTSSSLGDARLSMQLATTRIDVEQDGIIAIGKNGVFEINALNGEKQLGNLRELIFSPAGQLFLHSQGKLTLAANDDERKDVLTIWKSIQGHIVGDGMVEYLSKPATVVGYYDQSFIGKLQSTSTQVLFDTSVAGIKASDLVRRLVNEVPTLSYATVFTDPTGTQMLRLKNGNKVAITTGDVINSDDSTKVYGTNSAGRRVVYQLDGTRLVS